jgi:hypothetical protein
MPTQRLQTLTFAGFIEALIRCAVSLALNSGVVNMMQARAARACVRACVVGICRHRRPAHSASLARRMRPGCPALPLSARRAEELTCRLRPRGRQAASIRTRRRIPRGAVMRGAAGRAERL